MIIIGTRLNLYCYYPQLICILMPIVVQLRVLQGWQSCPGPSISKHAIKVHNCEKCTNMKPVHFCTGFIFCTLPRLYSKQQNRTIKCILNTTSLFFNMKSAIHLLVCRSQTCNCIKGSDWLKRWVEAQHNILVVRYFVIGQQYNYMYGEKKHIYHTNISLLHFLKNI